MENKNKPKIEISEKMVAKKVLELGVSNKMHNEYTIIAHLHQDITILAFFHIRVLKLACKPCYYWIKAFNKTISTKFSIKNSHDKWYTK